MKLVDYSTADILMILTKVKSNQSSQIESETIEFKEFKSKKLLLDNKNIIGELCSFANHLGGVLIIGVKDYSNLKNKNLENQLIGFCEIDKNEIEKRIRGKIQNQINLRVENIKFESKNYVAIYVVKNLEILVTTTSGKTYIRDGRDSRPMKPDEIESAIKSLQNYDWSSDNLQNLALSELNDKDVDEAFKNYISLRLKKQKIIPTKNSFLEAIDVTKNGILTKGGLLFLGKKDAIKKHLGDYEFRFSWKEGINLKINEIWSGNIWSSINRAKKLFNKCVSKKSIEFKGNKYEVPNLDPDVFHEAFLNAVVHRDYSLDGMIVVEFSGKALSITSPGLLYGGVTTDNIAFYDSKHRNKSLSRILMFYEFVDKAGMGIPRMGINSLIYGRRFPKFEEINKTVKVIVQAEFINPAIFVLTHGKEGLYLPDLILLNILCEKTYLTLPQCFNLIRKVTPDIWTNILDFINRWEQFVDLCGSKKEIYLRIKHDAKDFFKLSKTLQPPKNSEKFVKLFHLLKKHKWANSKEISDHLGFKQSTSANRFLASINWIKKTENGSGIKYKITDAYDI